MNYIKRLEQENADLRADKTAIRTELTDLVKYLISPKFTAIAAADRRFLVNTEDVLARIGTARTLALD